jgi:NitT/TauT family transport system ATP-binding protein
VFTSRPGRIKELITVELERPRYTYDARATPEFIALRERLWRLLGDEAKAAAGGTPGGD